MMAWNHYFPGGYVPELVKYVQDRDLWRNEMSRTAEINAYIRSWPYDFDQWSSYEHELQDNYKYECAVGAGEVILRYQNQSINNHCDHAKVRVFAEAINDVTIGPDCRELDAVPMVNCTDRSIVSALGHKLCLLANTSWSVSWRDEGTLRVFTLTSTGEVDVSEIARRQGGGGHKGAAGFTKALPLL
jgi:oligoribonuclease NrnB/cAMP/cGMP phosphodiesterase (DHH superfamily)